ncbi:hypothetical protein V491_03823 [Pseudogymnoascus sp. VKM F-3775]|nr:hypothetical protein V491_03823 [Pseudogymnoascus sp. VKM F-3775]
MASPSSSDGWETDSGSEDRSAKQVSESLHNDIACPTCRLIRVRVPGLLQLGNDDLSSEPSNYTSTDSNVSGDTDNSESDTDSCETGYQELSHQLKVRLFHSAHDCKMDGLVHLCPLCDHWLKHLLCRSWAEGDIATIRIGTFAEIEARSGCVGCQALCRITSELPPKLKDRNKKLQLQLRRDSKSSTGVNNWPESQVEGHLQYDPAKSFGGNPYGGSPYESVTFSVFYTEFILEKLVKEQIGWERVIEWIDSSPYPSGKAGEVMTASGQIGIRRGETAIPQGFCLISVGDACVVPMTGSKGPFYAALSYVWGNAENELTATRSSFEELQRPGRLQKDDVPHLIKDAMLVCLRIGLEYLWVDRLCIVQDDLTAKTLQLEAMGRIYSEAFVTLVSLERDGVRLGLPGVSRPRKPQLAITLHSMTLVPCYETAAETLDESTWSHRGWTYQEGFLSNRILLFGQDMLYMLHRPTDDDDDGIHFEGLQAASEFRPSFCCGSPKQPTEGFSDHVTQYTSRQLTYELDILNAFLGVLEQFGRHWYGIPLSQFDYAIMWFHADWNSQPRVSTDRVEMPTWSWISTRGGVEFPGPPHYQRPLYSVATWARLAEGRGQGELIIELLHECEGQDGGERLNPQTCVGMQANPECDPIVMAVAANSCDLPNRINFMRFLGRTPPSYFEPESGSEGSPESLSTEAPSQLDGDYQQPSRLPTVPMMVPETIMTRPMPTGSINLSHERSATSDSLDFPHLTAPLDAVSEGRGLSLSPKTEPPDSSSLTDQSKDCVVQTKGFPTLSELMEPIVKLPWYKRLRSQIKGIDPLKREGTLLRLSKPSLTLSAVGLSTQDIRTALTPGRILVRASKLAVLLRYEGEVEDGIELTGGRRMYNIERNGVPLGTADFTDSRHHEFLSASPKGKFIEATKASCIALSLSEGNMYSGMRASKRRDLSRTSSLGLHMFVMIVSNSPTGCSRRLGVGQVDVSAWISCKAEVETTILE